MGGGSFVDFDTTRGSRSHSSGMFGSISSETEEELGKTTSLNPALLPFRFGKIREVNCFHKNPIVVMFDVTGSMGSAVYVIYDRLGSFFIELENQKYLDDPAISFGAVGDAHSDDAPFQICQFSQSQELIEYLQMIWIERGGGGQSKESYEMMLYYYARHCVLEYPEIPFFFIIGDEGFYEKISPAMVMTHFGDRVGSIDSTQVFREITQKFHENVFLLHVEYGSGSSDKQIVRQWKAVLGERVIMLHDPTTVVEVMLGIIALSARTRKLDEYLADCEGFLGRVYKESKGKPSQIRGKVSDIRKILLPYAETVKALTVADVRGRLPVSADTVRRRRP